MSMRHWQPATCLCNTTKQQMGWANIRAKHELGNKDLDEDDKWLLEEDLDHVLSRPGCKQHNWSEDVQMVRTECAKNHPNDAPSLAAADNTTPAMIIRAEHEQGDEDLDEEDKWLLEEGVDFWLSQPMHEQRTWIKDMRTARRDFEENHMTTERTVGAVF